MRRHTQDAGNKNEDEGVQHARQVHIESHIWFHRQLIHPVDQASRQADRKRTVEYRAEHGNGLAAPRAAQAPTATTATVPGVAEDRGRHATQCEPWQQADPVPAPRKVDLDPLSKSAQNSNTRLMKHRKTASTARSKGSTGITARTEVQEARKND